MAVSIVSASSPGVAPMQDSLTYTEPLVPQAFATDGQSISSKAKVAKRFVAKPEPMVTAMAAVAAPRKPTKVMKRTD